MSAIRNAVELMKVGQLAPEKTAFARDVIDRQSALLAHLVDDLLDISRITRGKIELRKQKFDLAQAIHSAVETNRSLIEARRHTIHLSAPENKFIFDGDFARTVQIMANLVHNAAKYTAAGGSISIEVRDESGTAVIRVRDTGIGLPAHRLADIFQPFVQLERGANGSQGGLGVGLTLVKTLVELHGGTVQAISAGPGRGSEFVVNLPGIGVARNTTEVAPSRRRVVARTRGSA